MSLDNTALRLESSPFRISQFLKREQLTIAKRVFGFSIVRTGLQYGMTNRQLAKLKITQEDDGILISLKYHGPVRGDKPKQRWFVGPKGGGSGSPKVLSWVSLTGSRFFSKGHFVTGVDAKWVMDRAIKNAMKRFRSELRDKIGNFLEATKIG